MWIHVITAVFGYWVIGVLAGPVSVDGTSVVAFDCHDPKSSVWTVSLLNTPECPTPRDPEISTTVSVQLLQKSRYRQVEFYQCYIKRTTFVKGCGRLYDYTWELPYNYDESILSIPSDVCMRFHRVMSFDYWGLRVDKLEANGTVKVSKIAAGALNEEGDCTKGEYFNLNGKSFHDVIAQEHYDIGMYSGFATADLDADQLHLPSGVTSSYTTGETMDILRGYTTWRTDELDCAESKYDVLYQGTSTKSTGLTDGHERSVITVEQAATSFALELKKRTMVCNQEVYETEHPQLFIFISHHGEWAFPSRKISPQNVDFSAYVNTKFVYVEKHIRGQISNLYKDLLIQKCKVERMALNNLLTLALVAEDEFAYTYMESSGYTAIVRGEVAHVIKCAPVPVRLQRSERCYKEVPVLYQNKTYYLSPRNRLLQTQGTEVECHPLLPVMFSFDSMWFSVYPKPIGVVPPNILRPRLDQTFVYKSPAGLASSGLYTKDDLDAYQRAVIFSGETSAMGKSMARAFMGQNIDVQGGHVENLFSASATEEMSRRMITGMFGWAQYLGNWVATIMGLWFMYKTFAMILNWAMNVYSLYRTFGLNSYLLASFWDSMTHHLVINHKTSKKRFRPVSEGEPTSPGPSAPLESTISDNESSASRPSVMEKLLRRPGVATRSSVDPSYLVRV